MASAVSIHVDTRTLDRIIAQLDTNIAKVGQEIGKFTEQQMKAYAPVRTGWLRDHIYAEYPGGKVLVRVGSHDTDYAIYQEYGTYKMAAHPFIWPGAQAATAKFLSPQTWSPLFR